MPYLCSPFGGNTLGLRLPSRAGTLSICLPCSSASVHLPSPVDSLGFMLALLRQHLRRQLVHMLAFSRQHLNFTFSHALCPGHQHLMLSGSGFFSLASRFDASSSLGQGWCSTHDWQRPPSFVRINAQGFNFSHVRVCDHPCEPNTVKVSRAATMEMEHR